MADSEKSGTWRLTMLVASTEDGVESYESLDDMPAVMRAQCVRALNNHQAATILIADAAGREHVEALLRQRRSSQPEVAPVPRRFPRREAAEIALCATAGALLWVLSILL